MTRCVARGLAGAGAATAALALTPLLAAAHAVVPAGPYHVAIGWQFEPPGSPVTYVGQNNAIQVFIDAPSGSNPTATPVSDLNADCSKPDFQVTVTFAGTTSSPLCPEPAFDADTGRGRPDEYDVALTPTRVGEYRLRIFGTIHGTALDETVTSGPSTFDSVGDATAAEFPTAVPALNDFGNKLNEVGSRADNAAAAATGATNASAGAVALAYVAIIVAIVFGALNVVLMRRWRGQGPTP